MATRDLWQRVREGFGLSLVEAGSELHQQALQRVETERRWYVEHPAYLTRVSERATPYLHHVVESVERRGMPLEFALLPILESAYDPFAYSHGRAAGMWQIIPGTGRDLGLTQDWWYDGRRDLRASTDAALEYLSRLAKRFDGDWLKALAAYNAGPARISRAERRNRQRGLGTSFWELTLPAETRNYVPRLLALASLVQAPQRFAQTLTPIPDAAYLSTVHTGGQIDLSQAATLSGLDIDAVYRLNPGLNRWATPPAGPHELMLPIAEAKLFESQLSALDAAERLQWVRYTVRPGDALSRIARRYNTEADVIAQVNGLTGSRIVAGNSLMIPVASQPMERYGLSADQRLAARQSRGQGHRTEYTVRPGDSFWRIAREYGVSSRKVAEWNNMAVRDPLMPGQTLVVWSAEPVSKATLTAANLVLPEHDPMVRKINYRVRSGDSLARIAARFKVTTADILDWNAALRGKKYIHPGQRITLYVDVRAS
ncbi:MAG: LysM peptidoglycan-binding domain-containing protein [Pseudomonadota bacterium]